MYIHVYMYEKSDVLLESNHLFERNLTFLNPNDGVDFPIFN